MRIPVPLDDVSRELTDAFWQAPPAARRKAVLTACVTVAERTELSGPDVEEALTILRTEAVPIARDLCRRLLKLVTRLDMAYLDVAGMQKKYGRPPSLKLFRRARAASALAYALEENTDHLHQAIYEALAASDSQQRTELMALISTKLKESPLPAREG